MLLDLVRQYRDLIQEECKHSCALEAQSEQNTIG